MVCCQPWALLLDAHGHAILSCRHGAIETVARSDSHWTMPWRRHLHLSLRARRILVWTHLGVLNAICVGGCRCLPGPHLQAVQQRPQHARLPAHSLAVHLLRLRPAARPLRTAMPQPPALHTRATSATCSAACSPSRFLPGQCRSDPRCPHLPARGGMQVWHRGTAAHRRAGTAAGLLAWLSVGVATRLG